MGTIRIIPCLDVKDGRVVKGIKFVDMVDASDPVEAAQAYEQEGADELVMLDITATTEDRTTRIDMVKRVSQSISLPLAVGGGIHTIEEFDQILLAGAGKVGINSAAVKNPSLISQAAEKHGSKCVVVAIDAKRHENGWHVYINGGSTDTGKNALEWAIEAEKLGAGELLVTSIDCDGTKEGYDVDLTRSIAESVSIPVIASGGAGRKEHFLDAVVNGKADAVLAASLFHFKELGIQELKQYLKENGISVK